MLHFGTNNLQAKKTSLLCSMIKFAEQLFPKKPERNKAGAAEDQRDPQKVTFPPTDQSGQRKYDEDQSERHHRDPLKPGAVANRYLGNAIEGVEPEQCAGKSHGERHGAQRHTLLGGIRHVIPQVHVGRWWYGPD